MTAARKKLQSLTFKFVSLALCLWLSGATCAISCGAMIVRAGDAQNLLNEVTEESSCHGKTQKAQPARARDEKNDDGFSLAAAANQQPTLDCCTFLNLTAEKVGKIKQTDSQFAAASQPFKISAPEFARQTVSFQQAYQPIPLNRGSTYLRNCVFLI